MIGYVLAVGEQPSSAMGDYRRLRAYSEARALVLDVYRATRRMPESERYGLTSQVRRAAVSVAVNLAEGAGRSGDREFRRFVLISRGSAQELICEVELARDLGMLPAEIAEPVIKRAQLVAVALTRLSNALGAGTQPHG